MRTYAWCEDGDQSDKNDNSPQGVRRVHHGSKIDGVHKKYQREDFYPFHRVLCVSRYYQPGFMEI